MKTTFIILYIFADWQPVINAIPCLCWGIIWLIALYLILKFIVAPCIANCHENRMKKAAHEREIQWDNRHLIKEMVEKMKLSPDEWLKNQMDKLTENINKIANELKTEKEKEKNVIESLELRKNAYEEMLKHISLMVSLESKQPQDNNQVTDNNKTKE